MNKLPAWLASIDFRDRHKSASMMVAAQEKLSGLDSTNRWLFHTLRPFLRRRVVEVGCGLGGFLRVLARQGGYDLLAGTEISEPYLELLAPVTEIRWFQHDLLTDDPAPVRALDPDTILCFNVLEHLLDDDAAVRRLLDLVPPGGTVILLVPALPRLFCDLDRNAGHYRRYTRAGLRELVRGSGAELTDLFWFNFPGIFGWWFNGVVLGKQYLSNHLLDVFNVLVPVMRPLQRLTRNVIGISLIAVIRRPS